MNQNLKQVKEVLIIHTWGLGDMILLTPVLQMVYTMYPDVRFSFIIFQKQSALPILNAPYTGDVFYSDWNAFTGLKSIINIRSKTYDTVMFTSGVSVWKAGLFLLGLRAKHKISEINKYKFPFMDKYSAYDDEKSRTANNYSMMRFIFDLPDYETAFCKKTEMQFKPQFFLTDTEQKFATDYLMKNSLSQKLIIGIHPGCMAKNSYRRWPREYFVQLINQINQNFNCSVVIIGGPDELEQAKYIHANTTSLLLSGEFLAKVAAVISCFDYFINTDSGLGHIAACFDIKTLTIFGPGDERHTAPFSELNSIIRLNLSCAPCVSKKTRKCKYECLNQMSPDLVFSKFAEIAEKDIITRSEN